MANSLTIMKQDLGKMRDEFAKSLPGHITADKFVRTAQTAIALTRNIDRVKNPQSLMAACSKAASDGQIGRAWTVARLLLSSTIRATFSIAR